MENLTGQRFKRFPDKQLKINLVLISKFYFRKKYFVLQKVKCFILNRLKKLTAAATVILSTFSQTSREL